MKARGILLRRSCRRIQSLISWGRTGKWVSDGDVTILDIINWFGLFKTDESDALQKNVEVGGSIWGHDDGDRGVKENMKSETMRLYAGSRIPAGSQD